MPLARDHDVSTKMAKSKNIATKIDKIVFETGVCTHTPEAWAPWLNQHPLELRVECLIMLVSDDLDHGLAG